MKILCIGDFHGKAFDLRSVVIKNKIDVILCTGDLPDTEQERKYTFKYWNVLQLGISLEQILGRKKYSKMVKKTLESQKKVLQKLNSYNTKVILVWGNSDISKHWYNKEKRFKKYFIEALVKKYKNILLVQSGTVNIKDVSILAHSGYRFPSQKNKKKISDDDKKWDLQLKKLFSKIQKRKLEKNTNNQKKKTTIFLAHEPPYNTKLDYVRYKKSPLYKKNIGDEYYLKWIKVKKPDFMVCGHMHENQGAVKVGKTKVVCCGYGFDKKYAIIDTDTKKIKLI